MTRLRVITISRLSRSVGLILLLLVMTIGVSSAQEMSVPVNLQFALFSKVLQFDRNLRTRSGDEIIFGVVYQSQFKSSRKVKEDFTGVVDGLSKKEIGQIPFRLLTLNLDEVDLAKEIVKSNFTILYITPLRAVDPASVAEVARRKGVLTLTGVPDYVESGVAVGLATKGGKPQILINLKVAKDEHADFSSQLLKLVRIIESKETLP